MFNEFLHLAAALERTEIRLPVPTHPFLQPITNASLLVRINKKGDITGVDKIPDAERIRLFKLREKNDGVYAAVSFPSFSFFPTNDKSKPLITEKIIGLWIPKLISAFSKYPEMKNFVHLCETFSKRFDYDKFVAQLATKVADYNPEDRLDVFLDFDMVSDGYHVSNTLLWERIKQVMYLEFPVKVATGRCLYTHVDTDLANPTGMEVLCSKKLFPNGVVLYSKNTNAMQFSNNEKIQISRELYGKIASAAEWAFSDARYRKNTYPIDMRESALVCYLNSKPAVENVWAELICELPSAQETATTDIFNIYNAILKEGAGQSSSNDLVFFVVKKLNDSGFVIEGEGMVPVTNLVSALKKWSSNPTPIFNNKKFPVYIGLVDTYRLLNVPAKTIDFSELFLKVFLHADSMKCEYLLTKLIDRHWVALVKHSQCKKNEIFGLNRIALVMRILNSRITKESEINMKSVGQLCFVGDNLHSLYNELQLKRGSTMLCGYQAIRNLKSGQLVYSLNGFLGILTKYIHWAKTYQGDKVGLVKYYAKHAVDLTPEVERASRELQEANRLLTVNEKTSILLAYLAGVSNNN